MDCAIHYGDSYDLIDDDPEREFSGRNIPAPAKAIRNDPMMAPQGQGPLGGRSRSLAGIQPVDVIRKIGKANILATRAPERDHKFRKRMTQPCSTSVIVNGSADTGKLRRLKRFGV